MKPTFHQSEVSSERTDLTFLWFQKPLTASKDTETSYEQSLKIYDAFLTGTQWDEKGFFFLFSLFIFCELQP